MIPILYTSAETAFTSNGLGRLRDCIKCTVTEERNGIYECEFQYPVTGRRFKDIEEGCYIGVTHDDSGDRQPFQIYRRSAPLNGIVTFYARHISYRLNNVMLNPFTASSASAAMAGIESNSINTNPFTFWTDKTTSADFSLTKPSSVRGILGGVQGSIIDVYGGEYEFDRYIVKLHAARGVSSGVTIRYGKNMSDLEQDIDTGGTYDSIVPFWMQDGVLVVPDERIIGTTKLKPVTMDFTAEFEEQPTKTQLANAAQSYLNNNRPWVPKENIKIDFVQLWQTEEYKDVAVLQRVNLCDRVNVFYPALGVTAENVEVIKTVYNVLTETYDEMELGDARSTFAQTILKQTAEQVEAIRSEMLTSSMMDDAIEHATELITGGLGGHVVFTLNADGKPEEILIMDTDNVLTAVNVWRFNANGLGHSHNGYQGPYNDIALTADGQINADMITAGSLSANLIKGGTLKLGGINNGNGLLQVFDQNDHEIGSWSKDGANIQGAIESSWAFGYPQVRYPIATINQNGILVRGYSITPASGPNLYIDLRAKVLGGMGLKVNEDGTGKMVSLRPGEVMVKDNSTAVEGNITLTYPMVEMSTLGFYIFKNNATDIPFYADKDGNAGFTGQVYIKNLSVSGTKKRVVSTSNYNKRSLYCYETPTPLFGDIGEAVIDSDGLCYVDLDDIFGEAVDTNIEYQVFVQKEGPGDCYVKEKHGNYFVIEGTPNLSFAWEIKAKQRDYTMLRLEEDWEGFEEYADVDEFGLYDSYIKEQEDILNEAVS